MPDLTELLGDRAEVTLPFPAADIHVVYRPSVYTREFEAQLNGIDNVESDDEGRELCEDMLCQLITEWDLTDKGEAIPLSRGEIAKHVPVMFLMIFVRKLVDEIAGEAVSGRKTTSTTTGTTKTTTRPTPTNRVERRAVAARRR